MKSFARAFLLKFQGIDFTLYHDRCFRKTFHPQVMKAKSYLFQCKLIFDYVSLWYIYHIVWVIVPCRTNKRTNERKHEYTWTVLLYYLHVVSLLLSFSLLLSLLPSTEINNNEPNIVFNSRMIYVLCRFELKVQVRYVIKANSFKYIFVTINVEFNVFINSAKGQPNQTKTQQQQKTKSKIYALRTSRSYIDRDVSCHVAFPHPHKVVTSFNFTFNLSRIMKS